MPSSGFTASVRKPSSNTIFVPAVPIGTVTKVSPRNSVADEPERWISHDPALPARRMMSSPLRSQ